MSHFSGCRVVVAFEDGRFAHEDDDADLRIADDELLLSYWDDQGVVVLVGGEASPGCYALQGRSRPRRCTLQREDARTFTGAWEQGDERGTLRIELPAEGEGEEEA